MSTQEYEPGEGDHSTTATGESKPASASASAAADPQSEPRIYSDEWWERFAKRNPRFGDTVEQVRDTLDYGWRLRRERALAEQRAAARAARAIDPSLGRVPGRPYRQVNVKLGEPDFAALRALAIDRDLPPATLARMLLRGAIRDQIGA